MTDVLRVLKYRDDDDALQSNPIIAKAFEGKDSLMWRTGSRSLLQYHNK